MDILMKRLKAYTIDLCIVIFILSIIALIYHPDITNYQNRLNNLSKEYIEGQITFTRYINENSYYMKKIDEKSRYLNLINLIIIIIYFVVIPYFNKGTTIGKKVNHIKIKKIKKEKLTIKNLTIRSLIVNGLLYFISIIICTIIVPANIYFLVISFISIIQIILLVISIILLFKRKDKRSLHDILSRTYVTS